MKREELIEALRALTKRWGGPLPFRSDDVLEEYADKITNATYRADVKNKIEDIIKEHTHVPGAFGSEFVFGTEEAAKAILELISKK